MLIDAPALDVRVREVVDALATQPQRAWTVVELARSVGLSPSRLRVLFLEAFGIAPHEYLKKQRMLAAERLLTSSHLRVKEIMSLVGFADSSHFTRDFKALFGSCPTRYRRLMTSRTPHAK